MKVLVVADTMLGLRSATAGRALAQGWAAAGAECAVVPMGESGHGFLQAVSDLEKIPITTSVVGVEDPTTQLVCSADLLAVALVEGPREPLPYSSLPLGCAIRDLIIEHQPRRVVIDLAWAGQIFDAGAGFLTGLGWDIGKKNFNPNVADLYGLSQEIELCGIVASAEQDRVLLGPGGLAASRGYQQQLPTATALAAETRLRDFASRLDEAAAKIPGAGAAGGVGFAVLALGGTVTTGPRWCGQHTSLEKNIAMADLVVVGCQQFDFHHAGTPVVKHVSKLAASCGIPAVLVAGEVQIGMRELRTHNIQAAYEVSSLVNRLGSTDLLNSPGVTLQPATDAEKYLSNVAAQLARSWCW